MINNMNGVMGPVPGLVWFEVEIPYLINRNERDLEEGEDYTTMPKWDIWDWLEANAPDLHSQNSEGKDNGPVSWMRMRGIDKFSFFFKDRKQSILFKLRFGEEQ